MIVTSFLQQVRLPGFESLALAATGVRSLERFSDLAAGVQSLAPLKPSERLDVMDECLDLVLVKPDAPAGFEFTGLSVAEFRSALAAGRQPGSVLETWRQALLGADMQALREAARARIGVRAERCFLGQRWLRLPPGYQDAPVLDLPEALSHLLTAAIPGWVPPRRSRYTVELTEVVVADGCRLPIRGRRFPAKGASITGRWLQWSEGQLQTQPSGRLRENAELQLVLPGLEESYFSEHFMARNLFAHLRTTWFQDTQGREVLLLNEVQSDWMRDLRRQRSGKRPSTAMPYIPLVSVPECPVARDWLAIALDAFIDFAEHCGCDLIAWTPGAIQTEINPGLPLGVAQRLYDRRVPKTLARLLGGPSRGRGLIEPMEVDYPTYARNVLLQHRQDLGWLLVAPDGETPGSEPVEGFGAILDIYRARATPTIERLPALDLRVGSDSAETVMGIPIDGFGRLPEPEDAEVLWTGPARQIVGETRDAATMNSNIDQGLLFADARVLTEDQSGGHGNRWGAFAEDLDGFIERWLPVAMEHGQVVALGAADDTGQAVLVAGGEPRGMGLFYADRQEDRGRAGMLGLIAMDVESQSGEHSNVLWSAYPFFAEGSPYLVEVQGIGLHPNRLEARLDLAVAGTMVFAFDPLFYKHRGLYRRGAAATFSLAALAYDMAPTGAEEIVIDDPERVRAFRAQSAWVERHGIWTQDDEAAALAAWTAQTPEDLEPIRIDLSRGAMLMPGEEGPADDAYFQGEVTRVTPSAYVLFGVPIWRVEVIVARPDDQTFILPFFVPEHRFQDGWRPSVGDYVKGSAWVQGYLLADAGEGTLH